MPERRLHELPVATFNTQRRDVRVGAQEEDQAPLACFEQVEDLARQASLAEYRAVSMAFLATAAPGIRSSPIITFRMMEGAQRAGRMLARASVLGLALAGILALAGTISPASSSASERHAVEGRAPEIVSVGWVLGGRVVVDGTIDPEGLATEYEIKLACSSCGPAGYAPATGELPAVEEPLEVSLDLTGIKPGDYGFIVSAANADGEAFKDGELEDSELPPCTEGCGLAPGEVNEAEVSQGEIESADVRAREIFLEAEAARHASAAEEQQRKEALVRARRVRGEEESREAATREGDQSKPKHRGCVVPAVKGDTLATARRALVRADCRVGVVHQSARNGLIRRVRRLGARPGSRLAPRARVSLWLAPDRLAVTSRR